MTPGPVPLFRQTGGTDSPDEPVSPEALPAAGEDIRLRPGGGALRRGTAIPAGRAGQPLDGICGDREAGRVPVAAAHLRPLRDRMVARGRASRGRSSPGSAFRHTLRGSTPKGQPIRFRNPTASAKRRSKGDVSASRSARLSRAPGLLHAQRRHALRLRPRSAGLSGGGRSPRGTTGAQMRRRHPRRTPGAWSVTTAWATPGSNPANRRSRILPKKYIILPRALFSDAENEIS